MRSYNPGTRIENLFIFVLNYTTTQSNYTWESQSTIMMIQNILILPVHEYLHKQSPVWKQAERLIPPTAIRKRNRKVSAINMTIIRLPLTS